MTLTRAELALIGKARGYVVIAADATPEEVQAEAAKWRKLHAKARRSWRKYEKAQERMRLEMERCMHNLSVCVNHPRYPGKQGGSDDSDP